MTCQKIATDCIGEPARRVYLDAVEKGQDLCEPCIAAATRMGMNPVADRRSAPRIPAWRQRDLSRDQTGRIYGRTA